MSASLGILRNQSFTFDCSYIGYRKYGLHAIWMHNFSKFNVPYSVECVSQDNVFQCFNTRGVVSPQKLHPILLQFNPYEMKLFKAMLTVNVGREVCSIRLVGRGSILPSIRTIGMNKDMPLISKFCDTNVPIQFSVQHILMKPMPLHTINRTTFLMKNVSDETLYFYWHRKTVGGLYDMVVKPEAGIIKPKQYQPCQLRLQSLSIPVHTNDHITCVFMKYEIVKDYGNEYVLANAALNRLKDSFLLSDMQHPPIKFEGKLPPLTRRCSIKIGVSIRTNEYMDTDNDLKDVLKVPKVNILHNSLHHADIDINEEQFIVIMDVFSTIFWKILKSEYFQECISLPQKDIYYYSLMKHQRKPYQTPIRVIQDTLNHYLTSVLKQVFPWEKTTEIKTPIRFKEEIIKKYPVKLNNEYYENILAQGIFNITSDDFGYEYHKSILKRWKTYSIPYKRNI